MSLKFTKKEILHLFISILVVSLAFGFNDKRPIFELDHWLTNFIRIFVIVSASLIAREIGHKYVARKHGFFSEYKIWGIRYLWVSKDPQFPRTVNFLGKDVIIHSLPLGIMLSLLLTIISNGQLFFVAIGSYHLILTRASRFGAKYVNVTDYEEAKIALAGPIASLLIAVVFKFFNGSGVFDDVILINSALALFNLIPVSSLDGAKIFFGSKPLYVLSLVFIVGSIVLIHILSTIPSLILAAAISIVFLVVYYYLRIYK